MVVCHICLNKLRSTPVLRAHLLTHDQLGELAYPIKCSPNFVNAVKELANVAKLDADACIAEGKLLHCNLAYQSDQIKSLQSLSTIMVSLQHNILYKNFSRLVVFLLTLPVTSK